MSQINSVNSKDGPSFETYLESWDSNYWTALQNMDINSKTVINISFGDFTFSEDGSGKVSIGGLDMSMDDLQKVIDYIHSKGGKVKLSLGGATYGLSPHLKTAADAQALAQEIGKVVSQCNLDGIDLDIEDGGVDPNLEISFIHQLRENIGNDKLISLTVPGQAWAPPYSQVIAGVKQDVDCFNFMEYDIWVDPSKGYEGTIESDINTYITQFGLDPRQIQLGLMPGKDDMGHELTEEDAKQLAQFAKQKGLAGVMIWDLDRDFKGQTGASSYAYTHDITSILFGS